MNSIKRLIGILLLSLLIACTSNDINNQLTQTILIGNNIELSVPESFELTQLQGIDSYVAEIIDKDDDTFRISIDIGFLAGNYVDEQDQNIQVHSSANEAFLYVERESQYLGDDQCCVFYTFPELGPANFIANNDEHAALVFEIMKSLRSI